MKQGSFVTIQDWMRTKLNLKGNDLIIYAIIFGFSQTENQRFTGSLQYLADWCGATKQGVLKNLKSLIDKGLIVKEEAFNYVAYYSTELNGAFNIVERSVQHSLTNNISNKKVEKKENNINIKNFEFGKPKEQKQSLYAKCISEINSRNYDKNLHNALTDYLDVRLQMKDKPLYANSWKGLLNKLEREFKEGERVDVVLQSIERGYASFFPVIKSGNKGNTQLDKPWEKDVTCRKATAEEDAADEKWREEQRAKGIRVDF